MAFSALTLVAFAQKKLPNVQLKTIEGKPFETAQLAQEGKYTVVSFWATWCSPCKKELDAISEVYEDWQKQYGAELVAVSIDDARTAAKIPAMLAEKGWPYRVLLDSNRALQQAANVASVPHTIVVDGKGNVVYEHIGYQPGDEEELEKTLKSLSNKQ